MNKNPKTDHLKKHWWKPGQTGNPDGRPRTRIFTDMMREVLKDKIATDPQKRTKLRLMCEAMVNEAIKGNARAFKESRDTVDGRPVQALELSGADGGPIDLDVEGDSDTVNDKRIAELLKKAGINVRVHPKAVQGKRKSV